MKKFNVINVGDMIVYQSPTNKTYRETGLVIACSAAGSLTIHWNSGLVTSIAMSAIARDDYHQHYPA